MRLRLAAISNSDCQQCSCG